MSESEREILRKLKEKEIQYSLPKDILNQIYEDERLVLYKGNRRNMDEKILKLINQNSDSLDYTNLKEILDDNSEN